MQTELYPLQEKNLWLKQQLVRYATKWNALLISLLVTVMLFAGCCGPKPDDPVRLTLPPDPEITALKQIGIEGLQYWIPISDLTIHEYIDWIRIQGWIHEVKTKVSELWPGE